MLTRNNQSPFITEELQIYSQQNGYKQAHILDLSNIDINSRDKLNEAKEKVIKNTLITQVQWPEVQWGEDNELTALRQEIDAQALLNQRKHASDFTCVLLSYAVYDKNQEAGQRVIDTGELKKILEDDNINNTFKDGIVKTLAGWHVHSIQAQEDKFGHYSVIYVNEDSKQIVSVHRGSLFTDFPDLISPEGSLSTDMRNVLMGRLGKDENAQQQKGYAATIEAVQLAKETGYSLTITGHSLGGWLAQLSAFYCYDSNKEELYYPHVKAVTVDAPGTREMLEKYIDSGTTTLDKILENAEIVNYVSAPNFINSCNHHIGDRYQVANDLSLNKWVKLFTEREQFKGFKQPIESIYSNLGHASLLMVKAFDPSTGKPYKCWKIDKWPVVIYDSDPYSTLSQRGGNFLKKLKSELLKSVPLIGRHIDSGADYTIDALKLLLGYLTGQVKHKYFSLYEYNKGKEEIGKIEKEDETAEETFEKIYVHKYDLAPIDTVKQKDQMPVDKLEIKPFHERALTSTALTKALELFREEFDVDRAKDIILHNPKVVDIHVLRDQWKTLNEVFQDVIKGIIESPTQEQHASLHEKVEKLESKSLDSRPNKIISDFVTSLAKSETYIRRTDKDGHDIIEKLEGHIFQKGFAIISGMPGTGKSKLSIELCKYIRKNNYTYKYFTSEDDGQINIKKVFYELARCIYPRKYKDLNLENIETNELQNEVYNGLLTNKQNLLLVFENIEKPEIIKQQIDQLIHYNIRVLVTTHSNVYGIRERALKSVTEELVTFNRKEAEEYMSGSLELNGSEKKAVDMLLNLFDVEGKGDESQGFLPQTLSAVAAYFKQKIKKDPYAPFDNEFVNEYIEEYKGAKENYEGVNPAHLILLEQVVNELKDGWNMLQHAMYLAEAPIPIDIFDKEQRKTAGEIGELSLTQNNMDKRILTIHSLVRSSIKEYYDMLSNEKKLDKKEIFKNLVKAFDERFQKLKKTIKESGSSDISKENMYSYLKHMHAVEGYMKEEIPSRDIYYIYSQTSGEYLNMMYQYYYHFISDYKSAEAIALCQVTKLEAKYEDEPNLELYNTYRGLATVEYMLNKPDDALKYFLKAVEMFDKLPIEQRILSNQIHDKIYLSTLYESKSELEEAERYYQEAQCLLENSELNFSGTIELYKQIGNLAYTLAITYQSVEEKKLEYMYKALEYYTISRDKVKDLYSEQHEYLVYQTAQIARINLELNKLGKALDTAKELERISETLPPSTLLNKDMAVAKQTLFQVYHNKALMIKEISGKLPILLNTPGLDLNAVLNSCHIKSVNNLTKEFNISIDLAIQYSEQASDLYRNHNKFGQEMVNSLYILSSLYAQYRQDYEKAFITADEAFKIVLAEGDSITSELRIKICKYFISGLQIVFEGNEEEVLETLNKEYIKQFLVSSSAENLGKEIDALKKENKENVCGPLIQNFLKENNEVEKLLGKNEAERAYDLLQTTLNRELIKAKSKYGDKFWEIHKKLSANLAEIYKGITTNNFEIGKIIENANEHNLKGKLKTEAEGMLLARSLYIQYINMAIMHANDERTKEKGLNALKLFVKKYPDTVKYTAQNLPDCFIDKSIIHEILKLDREHNSSYEKELKKLLSEPKYTDIKPEDIFYFPSNDAEQTTRNLATKEVHVGHYNEAKPKQDTHWFDASELASVANMLTADSDVIVAPSVDAYVERFYDGSPEHVLRENLGSERIAMAINISPNADLTAGRGTHWVLGFIIKNGNEAYIRLINALGQEYDNTMQDLKTRINEFYGHNNIKAHTEIEHLRVQKDGDNCGPWVLYMLERLKGASSVEGINEALKNILKEETDIGKKREEYLNMCKTEVGEGQNRRHNDEDDGDNTSAGKGSSGSAPTTSTSRAQQAGTSTPTSGDSQSDSSSGNKGSGGATDNETPPSKEALLAVIEEIESHGALIHDERLKVQLEHYAKTGVVYKTLAPYVEAAESAHPALFRANTIQEEAREELQGNAVHITQELVDKIIGSIAERAGITYDEKLAAQAQHFLSTGNIYDTLHAYLHPQRVIEGMQQREAEEQVHEHNQTNSTTYTTCAQEASTLIGGYEASTNINWASE